MDKIKPKPSEPIPIPLPPKKIIPVFYCNIKDCKTCNQKSCLEL